MKAKRSRRSTTAIRRLRRQVRRILEREQRVSLTQLVRQHGRSLGIRDTASDRTLVKRQLDILAKEAPVSFQREGRYLIAAYQPRAADPTAGSRVEEKAVTPLPQVATPQDRELEAIRVYARQMAAFADTLSEQVATLSRLLDVATHDALQVTSVEYAAAPPRRPGDLIARITARLANVAYGTSPLAEPLLIAHLETFLQRMANQRFGQRAVRVDVSITKGSVGIGVAIWAGYVFFKDYDKIRRNIPLFVEDLKKAGRSIRNLYRHGVWVD